MPRNFSVAPLLVAPRTVPPAVATTSPVSGPGCLTGTAPAQAAALLPAQRTTTGPAGSGDDQPGVWARMPDWNRTRAGGSGAGSQGDDGRPHAEPGTCP